MPGSGGKTLSMQLALIQVPYHLGTPGLGTGQGPGRLILGGLAAALAGPGGAARVETVERAEPHEPDELRRVGRVNARVAERVAAALVGGALPVVLSGDCNASLGTLGGMARAGAGAPSVVWFDAHGDVNTPATSPSGFLDGMALAIALGRCHESLRLASGLEAPLDEKRLLLAAVRDLDAGEEAWLRGASTAVVRAGPLRDGGAPALAAALDAVVPPGGDVYLHLDLDALDPAEAPAVGFATPGGLALETMVEAVRLVARRGRLRALAVTNYDSASDEDDRTLRAAMRLVLAGVREAERVERVERVERAERGRPGAL